MNIIGLLILQSRVRMKCQGYIAVGLEKEPIALQFKFNNITFPIINFKAI